MTTFNKTVNIKRFISLLLMLSMLAIVVCAGVFSASAEDDTLTHGYLEYVIEDNEVCITGYTGEGGDVSIPNMINDMSVVAIVDEAFWYEDGITAVDLPDYLEFIGARAFQGCKLLKTITIPDTVIEIGDAAFCDCTNLASVNIPAELKYVGGSAFDNTRWITKFTDNTSIIFGGRVYYKYLGNAEVVTIPSGITGISSNAFADNQTLTYVSIPDSVVFIGDYSFYNCPKLTSVSLPDGIYYMGAYSFGYTSIASDGSGDTVKDFVLYANENSLAADYAQQYELECKSPSRHATPDELPDAETCVAKPLEDTDKKGGSSLFGNKNSAVAFIIIVVSCVAVIGGISLYFGVLEKKNKKKIKEEKKAQKAKKSKKK